MVEDGGEDLAQEQKQQFFLLLLTNADVFAERDDPGCTSLVKHHLFGSLSAVSLYINERKQGICCRTCWPKE